MESMNILITGGAGFIGSNLLQYFVPKYSSYNIINLDNLTYAGNLGNLSSIQNKQNYSFVKGDIRNSLFVENLFNEYKFDAVIHLAAESHVDRSIFSPMDFVETNVVGTVNLLNAFLKICEGNFEQKQFYHVSTDEVYGSLGSNGFFTEETPYSPRSPYSASKAASDHFVRAYGETFGVPFKISNCSNNYGPYQFPEKLIPKCIMKALRKEEIPIYGNGDYTRDWLHVEDHVKAIDLIFHKGKAGETYNIGGLNEWKNIDLINLLCEQLDYKLSNSKESSKSLIRFVDDRPGHDKRYAIDAGKLISELNWRPTKTFENGLSETIDWYLANTEFLNI